MKYTIISLTVLFFFLVSATTTKSQTFCLRLTEVSSDASNLVVGIEMNGSVAFELGTSNFQFSFDPTKLSNPTFESFSLGSNYRTPTVTTPLSGEASYNVELNNTNNGATMVTTPAWTFIGSVRFDVLDQNIGDLNWSYNGGTTETIAFLDDDATQIFATTPGCLLGLSIALPVELLSFNAQKVDDYSELEWATATEINNQGFEIQKSKNGVDWEKIGFMEGNGTSLTTSTYSYKDKEPYVGQNYYRLRQIDFDGQSSLTKVIQLYFGHLTEYEVFPNPAQDYINIMSNENSKIESVELYSLSGKFLGNLISDQDQVFDISTFGSGVYILKINQLFFKKIIINN